MYKRQEYKPVKAYIMVGDQLVEKLLYDKVKDVYKRQAFSNVISGVQAWFYNLLSTALTVVAGICEALNKLPFVEFDYSGITNAASDYAAKAAEASGNIQDFVSVGDAFNEGMSTFDTWQDGWVGDAFNAGANWGDGVASGISDAVGGLFDMDLGAATDYGAGGLGTGGYGAVSYTHLDVYKRQERGLCPHVCRSIRC